jgi:hypothetical protein
MGSDDTASVTRRSVIQLTGAAFALPAAGPFPSSNLENRRMSFTPNFVDLVRNSTTTTGTGNFVLGPAVNGFTGIAQALQAGDSFYYSAMGVDKPAEREVGRGTLEADGSVSRDPISGTKTNFTAGTKTLALIAAADWFAKIESTAGSASVAVAADVAELAQRAARDLPVILTEAGREGVFAFDSENVSALVAADTSQAVYVARSSDPTGAAGAWARRSSSGLDVRWFGAKGDGTASDHAAFLAAIALANRMALDTSGSAVPAIRVPAGIYLLGANTLEITLPLTIEGESERGTVLKWTNGTTGIRCQHSNTTGETGVKAADGQAGNLTISRLTLEGGYATGAESDAHAIHARTGIKASDLLIRNWPGEGIYLRGDSNPAVLGNCNGSRLSNIVAANCRQGIYALGDNVNACSFENVVGFANRQWGFHDRSVGNSYVAPLGESNARTGFNTGVAVPCSYVSSGGNRFFVIPGQEAWASANPPPATQTNNQGWAFWQAGGVDTAFGIPAWTAGISVRAGGSYFIEGDANASGLENPYGEDSEISLFGQCVVIKNKIGLTYGYAYTSFNSAVGAQIGKPGGPAGFYSANGGLRTGGDLTVAGSLAVGSTANVFAAQVGNAIPNIDLAHILAVGNATYNTFFNVGQSLTTNFEFGWIYDGAPANAYGQIVTYGYANDFKINVKNFILQDASGGKVGIGGAPLAEKLEVFGNAKATGSITAGGSIASSGAGIGYAAGAGGSVAQATSKSTAVTLNKPSGQVTTHNASLAAGGVISFVVNNSAVAASDTVNLNLKSGNAGAGTYRYWIEGVAAGSFKIVIENRSAGALAEALVFNFAVIKAVSS